MEDEDAAERTVLLQKESRLERSWETRNGCNCKCFYGCSALRGGSSRPLRMFEAAV